MALDLDAFDALTFDCYGTLIDWEAGLLAGLRPTLSRAAVEPADEELLEAYAAIEAELEAGPYRRYRDILAEGLQRVAASFAVAPTTVEIDAFSHSVTDWPAFEDASDALRRLAHRFRLGVITNCDDDLFAASRRRLGVAFDWVVSAEDAGTYKPNLRNFELMLERTGLPQDRILHVAQSLYHDHVPAKRLGIRTVWVHRRAGRPGFGATPPATAEPDLTVPDLASFAELATAAGAG